MTNQFLDEHFLADHAAPARCNGEEDPWCSRGRGSAHRRQPISPVSRPRRSEARFEIAHALCVLSLSFSLDSPGIETNYAGVCAAHTFPEKTG